MEQPENEPREGAPPAALDELAAGQSNAGQSNAGQSNAGQSNAGQSNAGQSNAGQSNADQSGGHDRVAAQGFVTIATAKVWFVLSSYAIHLTLPRLLGSPEAFGRFSTAMNAASILNNVLIASTIMTVSRFTSLQEGNHPSTLRRALWIQLGVGATLGATLLISAPILATSWLRDAALTPLLRIVSAVVVFYALYAAFVGSLNGRRLFLQQARLDGIFSTVRVLGILGGAFLFSVLTSRSGEFGALSGFALAALTILLVAAWTVGPGKSGEAPGLQDWMGFFAPLALYQFFLNGILLGDLLILKGTVASLAASAGLSTESAATLASSQVGVYSAAQKFAFVPYQLMIAMTFIVFPMVTRAVASDDHALAQRTMQGAVRSALLILMGVAAAISGAAEGVLGLAFPEAYEAGAPALQLLVFGAAAFALFVITASAHSGAGQPWLAAILALVGLVAVFVLNITWVRQVGIGGSVVTAAAAATSSGMLLALILSAVALTRRFGRLVSVATLLRVGLATTASWFAARLLPQDHPIWTLLAMTLAILCYLAVLLGAGELTRRDLSAARHVIGRG